MDSTIITNSGADTLTDDKIIKNACNKNNVGIIKKTLSNKDIVTRVGRIVTMVAI